MTTVFSIGYERKSAEDVCARLVAAGVEALVDVRERAWSHRPEFRKNALRQALAAHGIEYVHCPEAGNPFRPAPGEKLDFEDCTRQYRQHLRTKPAAFAEVRRLIVGRTVALFCYEREHGRCHRGVLLEELADVVPKLAHEPLE